MPENVRLHRHAVNEFLRFRAELKKVSRRKIGNGRIVKETGPPEGRGEQDTGRCRRVPPARGLPMRWCTIPTC